MEAITATRRVTKSAVSQAVLTIRPSIFDREGQGLLWDAEDMNRCKGCGSANVRDLGPLPQPFPIFGGEPFPSEPPPPGHLWRCRDCHLRFRSPYLSQAQLTALYSRLPDTFWSRPQDRAHWGTIRNLCR